MEDVFWVIVGIVMILFAICRPRPRMRLGYGFRWRPLPPDPPTRLRFMNTRRPNSPKNVAEMRERLKAKDGDRSKRA